jgi:hypothetical protein
MWCYNNDIVEAENGVAARRDREERENNVTL